MDISTMTMNGSELSRLEEQVNSFNKTLNEGKVKSEGMGKDEFLKILITQLSNQDPTQPMEDKEFIAQMAQFSSLEQMTNMSSEFSKMASRLESAGAMDLLGKSVDITVGEEQISGKVEAVTGGDYPQILIDGHYYDYSSVNIIRE